MAHANAVDALNRLLPDTPVPSAPSYEPRLVPLEIAEVTNRLRQGVRQYRSPKVTIDLDTVTDQRTPPHVTVCSLVQTQANREFSRTTTRPWGRSRSVPFAVALQDGKTSIVTPPVVEEHPEGPCGHRRNNQGSLLLPET